MKKKILVVDDEKTMLNTLRLILKMAGYKVETAEDGMEAFNKIMDAEKKEEQFDLLITDVVMPNLGGLGLLDKLNQEKMLIPVIVITGYPDRKMMLDLILKGCDVYLNKPIKQEEFIDRVNNVFVQADNPKNMSTQAVQ